MHFRISMGITTVSYTHLAGDLTGSYLSGKTEDEKYVYTHIAASYAYAGEAGFRCV